MKNFGEIKNFDDLTDSQKQKAINFARKNLEESFSSGLLVSNKPITEEYLSRSALMVAEGSFYDVNGDAIIPEDLETYALLSMKG